MLEGGTELKEMHSLILKLLDSERSEGFVDFLNVFFFFANSFVL